MGQELSKKEKFKEKRLKQRGSFKEQVQSIAADRRLDLIESRQKRSDNGFVVVNKRPRNVLKH